MLNSIIYYESGAFSEHTILAFSEHTNWNMVRGESENNAN